MQYVAVVESVALRLTPTPTGTIWTGDCSACVTNCDYNPAGSLTLTPDASGGCTVRIVANLGVPFSAEWNALALSSRLVLDNTANYDLEFANGAKFMLAAPMTILVSSGAYTTGAETSGITFELTPIANQYDWTTTTSTLIDPYTSNDTLVTIVSSSPYLTSVRFAISTTSHVPTLKFRLGRYNLNSVAASSNAVIRFAGPTDHAEAIISGSGIINAPEQNLVSSDSDQALTTLTINGSPNIYIGNFMSPGNTVPSVNIKAAGGAASLRAKYSLVDSTSASLNLTVSDATITSPITISKIYPTGVTLPGAVTLTSGLSSVSGYDLTASKLIGTGTYTNCILSPPSTDLGPGVARIAYNTGTPKPTALASTSFSGTPTTFVIRPGGTLELSNELTQISGDVTFGTPQGSCSLIAPALKLFATGSGTKIVTWCTLSALTGISGSSLTTISARTPDPMYGMDSRPKLIFRTNSFYDVAGGIDLSEFGIFEIQTDPLAPFVSFIRPSTPTNALAITNRPNIGTRIVWPTTASPPVDGREYFLYNSSTPFNDAIPAITIGADAFNFEIIYTPYASEPSISAVSFKLIGPVSPDTPIYVPSTPPTPVPLPVAPPQNPTAPTATPRAPVPPPSECSSTPPPGFVCEDGVWVAKGNVEIPKVFIVPTSVFVAGNLSVGGNIVFDGPGYSLIVDECLKLGSSGSIVLDLGSKGEKELPKDGDVATLVQQSRKCRTSLLRIPINIVQPKKNCKRIQYKLSPSSSRDTLSVVFSIDKSKCNAKWIALGASLAIIIILAVAGIAVGHFIYKKHYQKKSSGDLKASANA